MDTVIRMDGYLQVQANENFVLNVSIEYTVNYGEQIKDCFFSSDFTIIVFLLRCLSLIKS